jgi:SRSO17 transposase
VLRSFFDALGAERADRLTHISADGTSPRVVDTLTSGLAKSSTDAVGACHQYSGSLGGVGLCRVAVHLTYATTRGHALIDRALYLTKDWPAIEERREGAGVPDDLTFATKTVQTQAMLIKAHAAGVRASFFTGDEVYGAKALRATCRTPGLGYAVAVRTSGQVTLPSGRKLSVAKAKALVPAGAWQRMRTGTGSKGARDYDWAMLEVRADDTPDGQAESGVSVLLARRHRYTATVSYYRCWSPAPVSLARLVGIVCLRWKIEEDFQAAKNTAGLDKDQVTTWTSWHRWSTAALVAYTFLAVATALERGDPAPAEAEMIPLSSFELLCLLRLLILPAPCRDADHVLHWSAWRRRHQHRARTCHQRWHAYADSTP